MTDQTDYRVGDYVIANYAEFDTFEGVTFKIVGFTQNLLGQPIVRVVNIARPDGRPTTFYPRELSWEDGSRPTVDTTPYPPAVNRGAW